MADEKNTNQVHDEDCLDLEILGVQDNDLDKLSDIDKDFIKLNKAIAIARTINALDTKIVYTCILFREFFPEADIETIKTIGARIDDIDKKEVENISMGFINSLLTVNDKKYELAVPGAVNEHFGEDLKQLSKIDYYRAIIGLIKGTSDDLDSVAKKKAEFTKKFEEDVDDRFKKIIASPDKIEEYTSEYYKKKIEDPNTDDATKEALQETLKWVGYAYTLEPILSTIRNIYQEKGTTSSVMYGYRNRASGVFQAAVKTCAKHQISFPLKAISGIEGYLLGEKYKKNDHLFAYLLAWYIKYRSAAMTRYEKIFITQVLSIVTEIAQHKNDQKEINPTNDIKEKFSPNLKVLIDLVVDNCH
jgi:hypothetical protein